MRTRKKRHVCGNCGARKYTKYMMTSNGIWICFNKQKCQKRRKGANYKK